MRVRERERVGQRGTESGWGERKGERAGRERVRKSGRICRDRGRVSERGRRDREGSLKEREREWQER